MQHKETDKIIYMDNSSTTRQYDQVTECMAQIAANTYGNPSSLHRLGMNAEEEVKKARKIIAGTLGASEDEIYFTSCGTESDSTAIFGTVEKKANDRSAGKKIITTMVEHPAVLEPLKKLERKGYTVEYIGVDRQGRLNLDELKAKVDKDTVLITVMAVNNESGAIFPIREIADFKNRFNKENGTDIWLHSDCVQAFGKINCANLGADMLSMSAHKFHGPKGMGILYVKKGIDLRPFMLGGGQERGFRSGTENVPGIAGTGLAAKLAVDNLAERTEVMRTVRQRLLDGFNEMDDIVINSPDGNEVCPSVLNVSFLNTRGEVLLHTLEQQGIYVSTGSACASNHTSSKGSHVLNAMGASPKEIEGAIRFSLSEFNTPEEADYVIEKTREAVTKFRKLGDLYKKGRR